MIILAPTPLLAATFIVFGEVVRQLGTAYARLKPRLCESLLFTVAL